MTPRIMAQRTAQAQEQILHTAMVLAAQTGVDALGLGATHRDVRVQALLRTEALAVFLTDLSQALAQSADGASRKKNKGDV